MMQSGEGRTVARSANWGPGRPVPDQSTVPRRGMAGAFIVRLMIANASLLAMGRV